MNITHVTPNYIIVNDSSFSIPPSSIDHNTRDNNTVIKWNNISSYVGNNNNELSANETFSVSFSASSSRIGNQIPLNVNNESTVSYIDPTDNTIREVGIPQAYIKVNLSLCNNDDLGRQTDFICDKMISDYNKSYGIFN